MKNSVIRPAKAHIKTFSRITNTLSTLQRQFSEFSFRQNPINVEFSKTTIILHIPFTCYGSIIQGAQTGRFHGAQLVSKIPSRPALYEHHPFPLSFSFTKTTSYARNLSPPAIVYTPLTLFDAAVLSLLFLTREKHV